jgi:hypothetical protein
MGSPYSTPQWEVPESVTRESSHNSSCELRRRRLELPGSRDMQEPLADDDEPLLALAVPLLISHPKRWRLS